MRAWRWGRGGRGRIAAWREVLLVGLSSGQGWSEPRRGGFVGIEDGEGNMFGGRNMFGVAGWMMRKDGDVVRAGCVRGGGGAGDCGGGRYRLMGCWEMKTTSCFFRDPHHIPYVSALRI